MGDRSGCPSLLTSRVDESARVGSHVLCERLRIEKSSVEFQPLVVNLEREELSGFLKLPKDVVRIRRPFVPLVVDCASSSQTIACGGLPVSNQVAPRIRPNVNP
jgi:hypothetical protein